MTDAATPPVRSGPTPRRALLGEAARALTAAGVDAPWVEAQLLLAHVLGVEWGALLQADDVEPSVRTAFSAVLERRLHREPLQHITGTAPFRWIELEVGPGVFVPRPETELLVDLAASALQQATVVVDLCSGSGAVALAVAHEYPRAAVHAVERDPAALSYLRRNAARLAAAGDHPVAVVPADVASWRPAALAGRVDVVLANPPYVPAATVVGPEVHADPPAAVFGGDDGLELFPALAATAAWLLRPGGSVVVEHDSTHAAGARGRLQQAGFDRVRTEHDLAGRERFAVGLRTPATASGQDGPPWE